MISESIPIEFENSSSKVQPHDVEEFERKLDITLPEDYRDFLISNNGGKPSIRKFITLDTKIKSSLMFFIPLIADTNVSLDTYYEEFNRKGLILKQFIPIGIDPVNNLLCLSIKGEDKGSVYYWDKEEQLCDEGDNLIPSYKYMHLAAVSFSDFIKAIVGLSEIERSIRSFLMKIDNTFVQRFEQFLNSTSRDNLNLSEKEQIKNQLLKFLEDFKEELYRSACVSRLSPSKWNLMASKLAVGGKKSKAETILKNHKKRWVKIFNEFSSCNDLKFLKQHLLEHLFVLQWLIKLEKE
jgi:hypothetical protein